MSKTRKLIDGRWTWNEMITKTAPWWTSIKLVDTAFGTVWQGVCSLSYCESVKYWLEYNKTIFHPGLHKPAPHKKELNFFQNISMLNALVKMLRFPIEKQWLIGMFCLLRALEKTKTAFFFLVVLILLRIVLNWFQWINKYTFCLCTRSGVGYFWACPNESDANPRFKSHNKGDMTPHIIKSEAPLVIRCIMLCITKKGIYTVDYEISEVLNVEKIYILNKWK